MLLGRIMGSCLKVCSETTLDPQFLADDPRIERRMATAICYNLSGYPAFGQKSDAAFWFWYTKTRGEM